MSDAIGNNVSGDKWQSIWSRYLVLSPNLNRRIGSSVVMIATAVLLTLAGSGPFALLVLAVALLLSWEWGRLVRAEVADVPFLVHAGAISVAVGLSLVGWPLLALCALAVGVVILVSRASCLNPGLSAAGVVYAGGAALALIAFRADPAYGVAAVLFLMVSVWTNDTMAFVFGKAIGGAKLCPAISPNKTWAGFLGGIASSGCVGYLFAFALSGASPLRLAVIGVVLGAVAVAGDLFESSLKRRFGVKDVSALIPGHGGVMDRMDGIVAVALVSIAFAIVIGGRSAASALLIGN